MSPIPALLFHIRTATLGGALQNQSSSLPSPPPTTTIPSRATIATTATATGTNASPSSPYPVQDLIFGIFAVVLACSTLAVAIVQIVQIQTHWRRASTDNNATAGRTTTISLGVIGVVDVAAALRGNTLVEDAGDLDEDDSSTM